MKIGYACINTSVNFSTSRTCRLANASEARLRELIESNLAGLFEILKWNEEHGICLFRISSDIIPFASHPVNTINWQKDYAETFLNIGNFIKRTGMRVSMHPGQFVNINSPHEKIVESSLKEIGWHVNFLDSLGLDSTHRIIFHTGGVYNDKKNAMKRFVQIYNSLPTKVKARLSLENDDKNYNVWDVLKIHGETGAPLIFDNLHHEVLNTGTEKDKDIENILKMFFATWNEETGIPKIHYSTQKTDGKPGSHALSINIPEFLEFYKKYKHFNFDVMFETKDKEKSVLKAFEALRRTK